MRDYNLMRNMLVFIGCSDGDLNLVDFQRFGDVSAVRGELSRLRQEGLIESSMEFEPSYNNGTVKGPTMEGSAFLRDIEDDRVWALMAKTLEDAGLDLSYPLLKKVCETIVERYVMSKIPEI
ncbi:hypothetical protein [Ellagibacter isourolithinifaciens]|uniref:hypothetical protein n=1 Tax=Ellagibacter isourolithinifaciens TaxID=2137581 RepID=UPI003A922260